MTKKDIIEKLNEIVNDEYLDSLHCAHKDPVEVKGKKLTYIICEDCESIMAVSENN